MLLLKQRQEYSYRLLNRANNSAHDSISREGRRCVPGQLRTELLCIRVGGWLRPQSNQSAGPVRFLIFCSTSIFLLASLVAGRRPQCTIAGNVLHRTYPLEYRICSSQPRQKSCWASASLEPGWSVGCVHFSLFCVPKQNGPFFYFISIRVQFFSFTLVYSIYSSVFLPIIVFILIHENRKPQLSNIYMYY
jgi:hypothetical protein